MSETLPSPFASRPLDSLADDDLAPLARELCRAATERGAVVVREFGIGRPEDLARVARATGFAVETFGEESSPRTALGGGVATSTEYLAAYPIQTHNEFSYSARWPRYVLFACLEVPDEGGETPLASSGAILARLSSATRRQFLERGLLYERNYRAHSGVSWERAFGTTDRATVEHYCAEYGIDFEWHTDGALTTRKRGRAIRRHPCTDSEVWFNHLLLFSASGLEPASLRAVFERQPADQRSSNVYFGDGGAIPPDLFEEVRAATNAERRLWSWGAGDLLVVDNMLVAHGRMPYRGSRQVIVTMLDHWDENVCT